MAIENTVAGSILQNYSILKEKPVTIIGEEYLRIEQNLMALPGQSIGDLNEVHSHYMAIEQCRAFFADFPQIKLVESSDTALSAKEITEHQIQGRGAIASLLAAETYNLEVIAAGIETNKHNYTRFLIIEKENELSGKPGGADKSSLCFSLHHQTGSLSKVLSIIAFYDINLTKIQSMPIIGKEWQYFFYVDVIFDDYLRYRQCMSAISSLVEDLHILGEYKQGIKSFEEVYKNLAS
jgi:prephenate dehydratase